MTDEVNDVAADTSAEVEEGTNTNETSAEDAVDLQDKLDASEMAKSQILARAKKAEGELKRLKAEPHTQQNNNDSQLSEELKLIARGLSDEEIEQAKVIAKGKGIPLTESIKDPLFTIFQADLKEKERREKAKLGASKGSGETQEEVTGTESGASREDHMKAFKKLTGKK